MRTIVKCLNCGLKWVRIVTFGTDLETNCDLQYNCPKCGSNYYESLSEDCVIEEESPFKGIIG